MLKKTNFAKTAINDAGGIADNATSFTCPTGGGAKFPAVGASNAFCAVFWGVDYNTPEQDPNREIVEAYRTATNTFTITRAQENTSAQAWAKDSNFALVITKGNWNEIETEIETNKANASNHIADQSNPHNVTAAQTGATPVVHASDETNPHSVTAAQVGATPADHETNTSNPHSVTKAQVGLGNVTDDSQLKRSAGDFATFSEKTTPHDDDKVLIEDSEASGAKKYVKKSNLSRISNSVTLPLGETMMIGLPCIFRRGKIWDCRDQNVSGAQTSRECDPDDSNNMKIAKIADDHYIISYWNSSYFRIRLAKWTGSSWSVGNEYQLNDTFNLSVGALAKAGSDKAHLFYNDGGTMKGILFTDLDFDALTLTVNSEQNLSETVTDIDGAEWSENDSRLLVFWANGSSKYVGCATVNTTTISMGSNYNYDSDSNYSHRFQTMKKAGDNYFLVVMQYSNNFRIRVGSVSSGSMSMGSVQTFTADNQSTFCAEFNMAGNKVAMFWNTSGGFSAKVSTLSGTTLGSPSTGGQWKSASSYYKPIVVQDMVDDVFCYIAKTGSTESRMYFARIDGAGTAIKEATTSTVTPSSGSTGDYDMVADQGHAILLSKERTDFGGEPRIYNITPPFSIDFSETDVTGVLQSGGSAGQSKNALLIGEVDKNQTGMTTGAKQYVDSAGLRTESFVSRVADLGIAKSTIELLITG